MRRKHGQHLADGGVFHAEHVIDEDLAVVIGLGEAVARRMQLLVILLRIEAERIEIGVQMAAHAIGADHHDRAHGILRRAVQFGGGNLALAVAGRLALDLVGERLFIDRPLAVERGDEVALRRDRPVWALPRGALGVGRDGVAVVIQRAEEFAPFGIDAGRIGLVGGIELLDIGGVAAEQERRIRESGVLRRTAHAAAAIASIAVLTRHLSVLSLRAADRAAVAGSGGFPPTSTPLRRPVWPALLAAGFVQFVRAGAEAGPDQLQAADGGPSAAGINGPSALRPGSSRGAPAKAKRGCPPPPSPRSCPRRRPCRPK